MDFSGQNEAPQIYDNQKNRRTDNIRDENAIEEWDALEIFDLIRDINDPEHPLTLEQLNVAQLELINVDNAKSTVDVHFTPTIPHCSASTLIGLSIRLKLLRSLPRRFKVSVNITPGKHNQEAQINKQLNDKERVCAAIENRNLLDLVNKCLAPPGSLSAPPIIS